MKGPVKHIMISYQWDSQELAKLLYLALNKNNLNPWMDTQGGIVNDINNSMAFGVENAEVIIPLMTQKYQESRNCNKELN